MKPHNQTELNIVTMRFKYLFAFFVFILVTLFYVKETSRESRPMVKHSFQTM